MGKYVTAFDAIRARLVAAMGSGKKLDSSSVGGLQVVKVGTRALVEQIVETPSIVIQYPEIEDIYNQAAASQMQAIIRVSLFLKYGILDNNADNRLYNTQSGTGFLFFIEKVRDVLNETTGQVIDPRFGVDALKPLSTSVVGIQETQGFLFCEMQLEFQTGRFIINGSNT
jgi:hypothetical protein